MNRKNENIWGKGITDSEFKDSVIKVLLGADYYAADPLSNNQVNEVALKEIIQKYGDNSWKYRYIHYNKLLDEKQKLENLISAKDTEIAELHKTLDDTKFNKKYSKLCKQKIDLELKQAVVKNKMKLIEKNYNIAYEDL